MYFVIGIWGWWKSGESGIEENGEWNREGDGSDGDPKGKHTHTLPFAGRGEGVSSSRLASRYGVLKCC